MDKKIKLDDIVQSHIEHYKADINPDDIRKEIYQVMPTSYKALPVEIIKLISPSFVMKRIRTIMDDYSCYIFPILKGFEGYLKHLFFQCDNSLIINDNSSFSVFFDGSVLRSNVKAKICDTKKEAILEKIYDYFKKNRHVHFHASQILIATKRIEDINEATALISEVAYMIETTYIDFKS